DRLEGADGRLGLRQLDLRQAGRLPLQGVHTRLQLGDAIGGHDRSPAVARALSRAVSASRAARTRTARGWPMRSSRRSARTEGRPPVASVSANRSRAVATTGARSPVDRKST